MFLYCLYLPYTCNNHIFLKTFTKLNGDPEHIWRWNMGTYSWIEGSTKSALCAFTSFAFICRRFVFQYTFNILIFMITETKFNFSQTPQIAQSEQSIWSLLASIENYRRIHVSWCQEAALREELPHSYALSFVKCCHVSLGVDKGLGTAMDLKQQMTSSWMKSISPCTKRVLSLVEM
jgi:hypothetical protein